MTIATVVSSVVASVSFELRTENIWGLINTMQLIELFSLVNI